MKTFNLKLKAKSVANQAKTLVLAVVLLGSAPFALAHSKAHNQNVCDGIVPENDLRISEFSKSSNGINRAKFDQVISKVEAVYAPIVRQLGATLVVNRLWSESDIAKDFDGTDMEMKGQKMNGSVVNAFALRNKDQSKYAVYMFGGLARHPAVSEDAFALVVCHEIGHHLGGFPRKVDPETFSTSWASNEGQSDYFATMKCFRRVMEDENNAAAIEWLDVPAKVKETCSVQHKSQDEINLCVRSGVAGLSLANLFASLSGVAKPKYETPDPKKVSTTFHNHPASQCRLDTYLAGAACGVSYQQDFSRSNAISGACAEEKGDVFAVRPRCWYKPQN